MGRWLASFTVYREPRIIALVFLGFSSGLPLGLTGQTLAAWLTEEGLSLGAIGLFAAVGTLPVGAGDGPGAAWPDNPPFRAPTRLAAGHPSGADRGDSRSRRFQPGRQYRPDRPMP